MWSRSRWAMALVAGSLLLNLFLVGALLGVHVLPALRAPQSTGLASADRIRRLAPEERARFAAARAPFRPALRAARARVRAARAEVVGDIAAEVLDETRLAADLKALREAALAQQAAQHGALVKAVSALTPASRRLLVERMQGDDRPPAAAGVGKAAADRSKGDGHAAP